MRSLLAGRPIWFAHRSGHGSDMVKAARVGAVSAALWMGGWAEAVREPRKNALTCQSARKSLTSPTVADFIALLATLSRLYALRVAPSAVDTSAHCDEERASALTSLDDGASTPPLGVRDPCSRCSCSNDAGSSNSDENSDACHSPFERRRLLTRVRKPRRLDR